MILELKNFMRVNIRKKISLKAHLGLTGHFILGVLIVQSIVNITKSFALISWNISQGAV